MVGYDNSLQIYRIKEAGDRLKEGKVGEARKEIEKGYDELGKMHRAYIKEKEQRGERDYPESIEVDIIGSYLRRLEQAADFIEEDVINPKEVERFIRGDEEFVESLKKQIYTSIRDGNYESAKKSLDILGAIERTYSSVIRDTSYYTDEVKLIKDTIEDAEKGKVLPEDISSYITNTLNKRRNLEAGSLEISSKYREDLRKADYGNIHRVINIAESYDPSLGKEFKRLHEKLKETIKQTEEDKLKKLKADVEAEAAANEESK